MNTACSAIDENVLELGSEGTGPTAHSVLCILLQVGDIDYVDDMGDMDEAEKLAYCATMKTKGNALFKAGNLQEALARYESGLSAVAELDSGMDHMSDAKMTKEQKTELKNLKVPCLLGGLNI